MSITQTALRRPVTTLMAFVCLIVIGGIATRLVPLELFPEFDAPVLFVQIPYDGSTPEEIERQITRPAEEGLATITDVKSMTATSYEDRAEILLRFRFGTDTDLKAIEVREKLDGVRSQFPRDLERFFVFQFSTTDMPILQVRISSDRDLAGAYELLDRKLKRPLERIDGVSQVELQGVAPREVQIELDADRVAAHRVDLVDLATTLRRSDLSVAAGRVTDGDTRYMVRPVGQLSTLDAIRNLSVTDAGVRLKDVATVALKQPKLDHGRHLNRTYAVGLVVSKESGANTVEVAGRVEAAIASLDDDPEMQGINVYVMDNSAEGITSSLWDLLLAGLLGGVFALIVLYLFLRRLATTMIVTLAVPISILVTVGALYFFGLSLNVLSMMGLMLAVGMLVDNAVVVTENIHRHQHLARDDAENGEPSSGREAATLRGVKEVGLAVTAGTLTTAIVFLPMIVSQSDQVTLFLKHVSVAICIALGISLLISLTVVPLLTSRLRPPRSTKEARWIAWLSTRYTRLLDGFLRRRGVAAVTILAVLGSVVVPAALVKNDFFPNDNTTREVRLYFDLHDTYTVDRVEQSVADVEDVLFAHREAFEIESVYSYYRADYAQSTILLRPDGVQSVAAIQDSMRAVLPKLTIGRLSFTREGGDDDNSLRLTLSGPSSDVIASYTGSVAERLRRIAGVQDVAADVAQGEQEVRVVVDRDRARQYGFSSQQVAQTVSAAMRGQPLRRFRTANGEVQMRLLFQESDRQSMDQLRALPLQRPGAAAQQAQIPLGALADLEVRRGPRSIQREDRTTVAGITVGYDAALTQPEVRQRIDAALATLSLPSGYSWGYGAQVREEEESQNVMLMNLLLALALIYLVMAALFESLIHPAAIWTSILFAIVGVFWFFLLTNTTFSIMAWIGVLILIGVVVNNSIVLIDHVNLLRKQGLSRHAAVVRGGRERMRPILMTAATTILGLIPLCVGTTQVGGNGPAYYPMARAIVGGLAFSTVVTLVLLPAVYVFFDDLRAWGRGIVGALSR
jgi:HAE1 family hydrophobic/amphiphilic exporter-1